MSRVCRGCASSATVNSSSWNSGKAEAENGQLTFTFTFSCFNMRVAQWPAVRIHDLATRDAVHKPTATSEASSAGCIPRHLQTKGYGAPRTSARVVSGPAAAMPRKDTRSRAAVEQVGIVSSRLGGKDGGSEGGR